MEIVNFTPWPALVGGIFIGLASAVLLWCNGRIFGVSGIIGGLFNPLKGDILWRLYVIIGLLMGSTISHFILDTPVSIDVKSTPVLVVGGFLIGIGSRLGSGCTSGHAICGISRFSLRSITATCTFVGTGVLTVYLMNAFGLH
jgi:uncharacterized protein